jgi:plasmid stabilization system protein ParE
MALGFRIEISKTAEDDLLDGYWFYEAQQIGIGDYFLDSLYADIHSLTVFAGIHAKAYPGIYRTLSARFPFGIYYMTDGDTATVVAVLDTRRNPKTIRSRLSASE